MRTPVHIATVPAGINPGGLWVRLCTTDALVVERPLSRTDDLEALATGDGELAAALAEGGELSWCYIYDGDSGECVLTMVVGG